MKIHVTPVSSGRDMRDFIKFPVILHGTGGNWISPLHSDVKKILSDKNPFWDHALRKLFLAHDDHRIVGRIAAVIDFNHIRFHQETTGFWGFFESIDDPDVSSALFRVTETFLERHGMSLSRGPMNPSTNEECGLLIDGFSSPSMIMMPYHPPYYSKLVELSGYTKGKDLYAYRSEVTDKPIERLRKLSSRVLRQETGLTVRRIDLKNFNRELNIIQDIYNSAWIRNWGFVPLTGQEIEHLAKRLKPLVVADLIRIALMDDDPAGFIMTLPDYNQCLKGLNGRLTPVNLLRMLIRSRGIHAIRLVTLGIKAEYRQKGIDAVLYHDALQSALQMGYRLAEYSWILEENVIMQKAVRLMDGWLDKTYRLYEKKLSVEAA